MTTANPGRTKSATVVRAPRLARTRSAAVVERSTAQHDVLEHYGIDIDAERQLATITLPT